MNFARKSQEFSRPDEGLAGSRASAKERKSCWHSRLSSSCTWVDCFANDMEGPNEGKGWIVETLANTTKISVLFRTQPDLLWRLRQNSSSFEFPTWIVHGTSHSVMQWSLKKRVVGSRVTTSRLHQTSITCQRFAVKSRLSMWKTKDNDEWTRGTALRRRGTRGVVTCEPIAIIPGKRRTDSTRILQFYKNSKPCTRGDQRRGLPACSSRRSFEAGTGARPAAPLLLSSRRAQSRSIESLRTHGCDLLRSLYPTSTPRNTIFLTWMWRGCQT